MARRSRTQNGTNNRSGQTARRARMMNEDTRRVRVTLGGLLMGGALLLMAGTSFAGTPTPGANCDQAVVVGSDAAGKVRVGTNVGTCTLTVSQAWASEPSCTAVNEGP